MFPRVLKVTPSIVPLYLEKAMFKLEVTRKILCEDVPWQDVISDLNRTGQPWTKTLSMLNHTQRFQLLLEFERREAEKKISFIQQSLRISKGNKDNELLVEVAEHPQKSEKLLHGKLRVVFHSKPLQEYLATIKEVKKEGLVISLDETSEFFEDDVADVELLPNYFYLKTVFKAWRLLENFGSTYLFLFFPATISTGFKKYTVRQWQNTQLNEEQKTAVEKFLGMRKVHHSPFLLFGPPGTGKTTTLIEIIVQVWYKSQRRQLICGPSNAACDFLMQRLIAALPDAKIYRLFSKSATAAQPPPEVVENSNYYQTKDLFEDYLTPDVLDCDIVICTVLTSMKLASITRLQFGYLYIDESGQLSEPDLVIAVSVLLSGNSRIDSSRILLAGDPLQLGPVIHSQVATDFGLGVSLLERLMQSKSISEECFAHLVKSYRSHPAILHVPNLLFYNNMLEVIGNNTQGVGWESLPNKSFPVLFHGVEGDCNQDADTYR
ncbi:putative helicase mov-10-B.1 [Homalodisca vitripennis]|uniref:putative helicase mov-10-B.1 n=1 Tax=Homalodisca vitripennis TaxID=197043 RepID=UPI001EEB8EC9|nr:putative helicase mov-10-B.1 [Homalodisca vitripennis]